MDECPICLETLHDETTIMIVGCCSKQFHTECFMKCIKNECPMCRAPHYRVHGVHGVHEEEVHGVHGEEVIRVHEVPAVRVQYKRYILIFLSCFTVFTISMFITSLVKKLTL